MRRIDDAARGSEAIWTGRGSFELKWTISPTLGLAADAAVYLEPGRVVESGPPSNWTYFRRKDELRNGEIVEARIRSNNSTDLDFPYGDVHLNITIRQHPEWGKDVLFVIDKGQILCGIRDCSGMINIDGKAERLSLNESADNDSSVVFASYAPAIIKKLQSSKKVIVELPFFQNGNRQFTFDTAGLEWPPKK